MSKKKLHCDLCGLEIDGDPIVRTFDGEEKHFCCEGCARVYEVAREQGVLDQVVTPPETRRPSIRQTVLPSGETAHFSVRGMWCAGCAAAAEQFLRHTPGIDDAEVSFAAERGRIQYDPEQVDPSSVLKRLDSLGYRARLLSDLDEQHSERRQTGVLLQLLVAAAFGMQVMILYLVQLYPRYAAGDFNAPDVRRLEILVWILATPIMVFGASSFLRGAWRALRSGTATMDTLVALGTLSAYGYSAYVALTGSGEVYFDSVAMITTFVMLGRYLETLGGTQARKDIRNLLRLQPDEAWKRSDDGWQHVEASALAPGDTVLVKAGERVPADAQIVEGQAAVNEALLTGESAPVDKEVGDTIFAGTVVTDAALTARVTRAVGETRLAHITQVVAQTLAAKPPIQRLADRAAGVFAFGILGAAVLTGLGWALAGRSIPHAILTAVAVLVVACPCALGLATPLALSIALGRTARAGVLVRNPAALETAATTQRIVFDKTGTLTRGRMAVTAAVTDPEAAVERDELLCLAAAVEQYSEHPIARAIVEACGTQPREAHDFQSLRGMGASARLEDKAGNRILVGSADFLGMDGHSPLVDRAHAHSARGETVVWLSQDGGAAGFIALRDEPEPTAHDALRQLEHAGVQPVMLSGDDPRTAAAIAAELGLEEFEGRCPPTEKASRIEAWQEAGERVAMVGDGVNDAPALAQADLSLTVASGTDVAGETSDVVLMRHDLTLIPWLVGLSRRTRRIIRENLGWAFAYNLVAVPLAALGIISPAIAAAAMATSSLLVVGNSLRLRH